MDDEKKDTDAAEEAQDPLMRMQHIAMLSREYSAAKSMHDANEHHPKDFLAKEVIAAATKQGATEKADDAKEKMPETVLVFFSYYSLESSWIRFSAFSLSYKYCAKRSTNIFRCRGVKFLMMLSRSFILLYHFQQDLLPPLDQPLPALPARYLTDDQASSMLVLVVYWSSNQGIDEYQQNKIKPKNKMPQ